MSETQRNLTRNVILWFPFFREIDINKDPGQIAEHLATMGYNVSILTYENDWNGDVKAIGKSRLITLKSTLKPLRLIGIPQSYYVLRNRKAFDFLILYFADFNNAVTSALLRVLKGRGVCIVKMDSDGRIYRASGYLIKRDSQGMPTEVVAYRRNLAARIFYRLIGELTFRILSLSADFLVIESPEARQRVLRTHPWLEHKLIVLPNGLNLKKLDEMSKSISINRRKTILYVGRVEYAKGVDLLINAFSRLKDKHPDWNVELVGEISASFKNQLEGLITKDLEDRVVLAGPLYGRELAERYLQAKIFCFASRSENFPIALLEAMYFGSAVISSNVGASSYILNYGNAGLTFDSENTEQLTACLDKLMGDEALRNRLAEAAKSRCEELLNWERIVGELDHHISSILARHHL